MNGACKILTGIAVIASAPLAVAIVANVAATTAAFGVVYGGLSTTSAISSGLTTMGLVEELTVSAGKTLIASGANDLINK
jgi:hypothetical protein